MISSAELLRRIRVAFLIKLQEKTGWGRNQIIEAYDEVVREIYYEIIEEEQKNHG